MDSVGLDKEGAEADSKTESHQESTDGADGYGWLGKEEERLDVAQHQPYQQNCTELSATGLDDLVSVEDSVQNGK